MEKLLKKIRNKILARKPLDKRYPQYKFGRGTYGWPTIHEWDESARLEVGSFCSIAANVNIFLGGEHRIDWVTTYPFSEFWAEARGISGHPKSKGNVIIGHDVWLGQNCVIMLGVNIGHGAVVGARAVVTKDVPPYGIVVGNPARLVKYRFSEEVIERLLKLSWWEWESERISKFCRRC